MSAQPPTHDSQPLAHPDDLSGTFGRYQIVKVLGRGGMGVVYEASDPNLNRPVALKVIGHTLPGEQERRRFEREGRTLAQLNHPNIVQVFDLGQEQGRLFLAMELVDGENLGKLLAARSRPLPELLAILAQTAQAVHYAHQCGVIHRDLKPSNIMITRDGQVKVMDFGLAKSIHTKNDRLTKSFEILGTPEYMSPEQAEGKTRLLDAKSDIYSLGVILYEILTGQLPLSAPNLVGLLYKIKFEEPKRPGRLVADLPLELEAIALQAIHKKRERRYRTTLELAQDITGYLEGKPISAKSPGKSRKPARSHRNLKYWGWSAGGVALLIAIAVFLLPSQVKPSKKNSADSPQKPQPISLPETFAPKLWQACWDERRQLFDFTATDWLGLEAAIQGHYALAYQQWYADKIGKPVGIETEGIALRLIPPGIFYMGTAADDGQLDNNEQRHKVTLTKPFYLGKTEVTQAQWLKAMQHNPSSRQNDDAPVTDITWYECQTFCEKIGMRLPTEAEWEYACRAGVTAVYCFGNDPTRLDNYAWFQSNCGWQMGTQPVGNKEANAWGCHDVYGNVWEWCQDSCGGAAGITVASADTYRTDRQDPVGVKGENRIYRGGWAGSPAVDCRSANRCFYLPSQKGEGLGLRVVKPVF